MKVNALRLDQWGVPTYNELVFVTGPGQLKSESSTLAAFQRATFRGYAYAAAHPAEAAAILLKAPGVLSNSAGLIQHSIRLLGPLFHDSHGRYGIMSPAAWQTYANWMTAGHLLPDHLNAGQALTLRLLP
jgi:ABC-type nitrate/sulfonate/bicarbonate transport system substrate-binding protein